MSIHLSGNANNATTSRQQPSSWQYYKEQGNQYYDQSNYVAALDSYSRAYQTAQQFASRADQQILLSNLVACRLHIGGADQLELARADAHECVRVRPQWSPGHVRLASVYSALGSSNEACNALQTALRIDGSNVVARQMLVRELRGRDERSGRGDSSPRDNSEHHPPPPYNPQYSGREGPHDQIHYSIPIDTSVSLRDRLSTYVTIVPSWYQSLSYSQRLKLQCGILFLALLGLCALHTTSSNSRNGQYLGNYEKGNIYDEYYKQKQKQYRSLASSYYGHSEPSLGTTRQRFGSADTDDYGTTTHAYASSSSSSWADLVSGNHPLSILLIAAGLYLAHRLGIHPFHAMWMMQMVGGRQQHHHNHGWAGVFPGWMGGGMMGRGRRRRPGRFW